MPKEKINHPRTGVLLTGSVGCTNEGDAPTEQAEAKQIGTVNGVPLIFTDKSRTPEVGDVVTTDDAIVQVGWHKDTWVQVSIEADKSYFRFAAENPDGETSDRSTIYTPPLTREDLNKLIRVLRRAREQVFGRDE